MCAVISGRKRNYNLAWYHIKIAKEKNKSEKKIDDFIAKLKTVSEEPKNPNWISDVYRGIEIDASERTFDLLEKLLSDPCSQSITSLMTSDFKSISGNSSELNITFQAREEIDGNKIVSFLKKINNNGIEKESSSEKELKIKVTYNQIKAENSDVKQIKNINDFISDLNEDKSEIAINNVEENDPKSGKQEITYNILTRDFGILNSFMREISPYSLKYIIEKMDLVYVPNTKDTMWNIKIKVVYKV